MGLSPLNTHNKRTNQNEILMSQRVHGTTNRQSNIVGRHSYRGGGIKVWVGISLGGYTDLLVLYIGTITAVRYRDEPYVIPYDCAIDEGFIQLDENSRPYRAGLSRNILRIMIWGEWIDQLNLWTLIPFNMFGTPRKTDGFFKSLSEAAK
ncbi:hypothetical protein AVEN_71286-1 [Araneus ventricosus]|uniref:Uncharacterized protein n=1 Tax=Araneus ventricosus TaxID=182803 RepID=A0A4Y2RSV1_ARAVE|nr:hypothetical protein AVEN_71286-1 [Araneus ventricosus]